MCAKCKFQINENVMQSNNQNWFAVVVAVWSDCGKGSLRFVEDTRRLTIVVFTKCGAINGFTTGQMCARCNLISRHFQRITVRSICELQIMSTA